MSRFFYMYRLFHRMVLIKFGFKNRPSFHVRRVRLLVEGSSSVPDPEIIELSYRETFQKDCLHVQGPSTL